MIYASGNIFSHHPSCVRKNQCIKKFKRDVKKKYCSKRHIINLQIIWKSCFVETIKLSLTISRRLQLTNFCQVEITVSAILLKFNLKPVKNMSSGLVFELPSANSMAFILFFKNKHAFILEIIILKNIDEIGT